ncbi:MAG: DUF3291 domain-containing protein [Verrucomicrobia bacterium]|nr:MAG: DUF3291 domain-containing protein [Verrucomicrobiota bacterium]PYJ93963.1 MAG: DUF3291 domain-containing protein [Verrucomicrobiota bacterium]
MSGETGFCLAQANVALAAARFDSPTMAGMVSRLTEINALAERSPGFVWRFQNPPGFDWLAPFADYFDAFEPERIFFNMSVWENVEDLRRYVFETAHVELLRGKEAWMLPALRPHLVLWWIPSTRLPTVEEGRQRLALLARRGPTREAFSFAKPFPPPVDVTSIPDSRQA